MRPALINYTAMAENLISRLQEFLQQWKYPLAVYREAHLV